MPEELSQEEVLAILAGDANKSRSTVDRTEPRIAATWIKLVIELSEVCENPDCCDTRPADDKGRLVTVLIKGRHMCRYCFLAGWLSDATNS